MKTPDIGDVEPQHDFQHLKPPCTSSPCLPDPRPCTPRPPGGHLGCSMVPAQAPAAPPGLDSIALVGEMGVQLDAHVPPSTRLELEQCNICDEEFEDSVILVGHQCAQHGFVFGCYAMGCGAEFVTVGDLKKHVKEDHS